MEDKVEEVVADEVVVEVAEEVGTEVLGMEVGRVMVMGLVGVEEEMMSSLNLRDDFVLYNMIIIIIIIIIAVQKKKI